MIQEGNWGKCVGHWCYLHSQTFWSESVFPVQQLITTSKMELFLRKWQGYRTKPPLLNFWQKTWTFCQPHMYLEACSICEDGCDWFILSADPSIHLCLNTTMFLIRKSSSIFLRWLCHRFSSFSLFLVSSHPFVELKIGWVDTRTENIYCMSGQTIWYWDY